MKKFAIVILVVFIFAGCVEDFNLKLQDAEPRLVVEGWITNKPGPYYLLLTKSKIGAFSMPDQSYTNNAETVKDALVVISDDAGQVDTLKFIPPNDNYKSRDKWFQENYKTSRLKGIPGRTYVLKIKVWGKEFEASGYMSPVPEIDSLRYAMKTAEKDGARYYVPLLNFKEPQDTENYYLVQLKNDFFSYSYGRTYTWQYSIFSDTHMKSYVSNLNINTGTNPRGIRYIDYQEGDSIYVALSSLTKEGYNYYKVLLEQFENDGGTYKPTPATPKGNISNGALGLFRASAVSVKRIKIR